MTRKNEKLPDNYEIYFSQVTGLHSIWYAEDGDVRAELIVGGFKTREDAITYLLNK